MLNIQPEKLSKWADIAFRVLLLVVLGIIAWRIPSIPSRLDVDARVYTTQPQAVVTEVDGYVRRFR